MVYLIHFDQHLAHARHYIGTCRLVDQRMKQHESGNGAKILAELKKKHIRWKIVRVWKGSYELEAKIKKMKNGPLYCPICQSSPRNIRGIDEFPINLTVFQKEWGEMIWM